MASGFQVVLDTTAPQLTWGAVAGTTAGELLTIGYSIDEPALTAATLRLADGREQPMTVAADRLTALLAPDTPSGWAQVIAVVRDDVDNERTAVLPVLLAGVAPPPVQRPPSQGPPAALRRPRRHRVRDHATLRLTSRTRVQRELEASTATARIRVGVAVRATGAAAPNTLHLHTTTRTIATTATGGTRAGLRPGPGHVGRRDGPSIEEALLLDLL